MSLKKQTRREPTQICLCCGLPQDEQSLGKSLGPHSGKQRKSCRIKATVGKRAGLEYPWSPGRVVRPEAENLTNPTSGRGLENNDLGFKRRKGRKGDCLIWLLLLEHRTLVRGLFAPYVLFMLYDENVHMGLKVHRTGRRPPRAHDPSFGFHQIDTLLILSHFTSH